MKIIKMRAIILSSYQGPNQFQEAHQELLVKGSDVLIKLLCFSVDPVMKFWAAGAKTYFHKVDIGSVFNCFGLGVVVQGDLQYPEHSFVFGNLGTAEYCVLDAKRANQCFRVPEDLVQRFGHSGFLYLVNNGLGASCSLDIFQPQPGQTVVVSTAAGATGILVCQLLRSKGLRVIGLTSHKKLPLITSVCDLAVDYGNKDKLKEVLKANPFDFYFDNVGQWILDLVLGTIKPFGRIALCGAISNYSSYESRGIHNIGLVITKRLRVEGLAFLSQFPKMRWIKEIDASQFSAHFNQILSPGNSIGGKVIVKFQPVNPKL